MSLSEFKGPDPKPSTEGGIGRPKPVARSKARTHRSTWRELHGAKGGACRLCGKPYSNLHHFATRENTFHNLIPLCGQGNVSGCHGLIHKRDPEALRLLAERLTDSEYAYAIEQLGEGAMTRLFGVMDERTPS